ncbi:N-alpha-acetyltransferase 40 NatD catalytic subunit [Clonorchis sinensis]|uniref:N-alpha-acetyltransferase 40 n=1 Tax=Clonorchis sinensis TaxID=79923 RepID=G7YQ19_CLOSI|nr:N-alpha-acetyltransferase 40 NatD catalytic subunit [Clonorchis sinensis]
MVRKSEKGGLLAFRKAKAKELVDLANVVSDPLANALNSSDALSTTPSNFTLDLQCSRPQFLPEELLNDLFSILQKNMQSSWGWDEDKKRAETFSPKAWLLLCRIGVAQDSPKQMAGFVSFRFEREGQYAVLYCYDIQLREEFRGLSIGRYLMDVLSMVARTHRMERLLLTVFKANKRALKFFHTLGFKTDESDPSQFKDNPPVDYQILSKIL